MFGRADAGGMRLIGSVLGGRDDGSFGSGPDVRTDRGVRLGPLSIAVRAAVAITRTGSGSSKRQFCLASNLKQM